MPASPETIAKDLRAVVLHEICHAYTVMQRCPALSVMLKRNETENLVGRERTWVGRVYAVRMKDNDAHKDAIYGWAGIVGDHIEVDRATAVDKAWALYETEKKTISGTDLESIEKVSPENRRKAAEDSFDRLLADWDEIKNVQSRTVEFVEKRARAGEQVNIIWREGDGWLGI